jgi:hypothetical protein
MLYLKVRGFAHFSFRSEYHWEEDYGDDINNQLDATILVFNKAHQLNMFRTMITPVFRSTRLFLQLVV